MQFIPNEIIISRKTGFAFTYLGNIINDNMIFHIALDNFGINKEQTLVFDPKDFCPTRIKGFYFLDKNKEVISIYDDYHEIEHLFGKQDILIFCLKEGYRKLFAVQNGTLEDFLEEYSKEEYISEDGYYSHHPKWYYLPISEEDLKSLNAVTYNMEDVDLTNV